MERIINKCTSSNQKCVLQIDDKYFGYDDHPQYPESRFKDINKAYIFRNYSEVNDILKWHPGKIFTIVPIKTEIVPL